MRALRFWLDRGVDGFRIDVAHGIAKDAGLPDMDQRTTAADRRPRLRRPAVRRRRRARRPPEDPRVVDAYPRPMAVGEVLLTDIRRLAATCGPTSCTWPSTSALARPVDAAAVRAADRRVAGQVAAAGAPPTWVLSNHDRGAARDAVRRRDLGRQRAWAIALLGWRCPAGVPLQGRRARPADADLPDGRGRTRSGSGPGTRPRPGRCGARCRGGDRPRPSGSPRARRRGCRCRAWGGAHRWSGSWRTSGLDAVAVPAGAGAAQDARPRSPATRWSWYGAPEGCFAFRRPGGLVCLVNLSGGAGPAARGARAAGQHPEHADGAAARAMRRSGVPGLQSVRFRERPGSVTRRSGTLRATTTSRRARCEDEGPRLHRAVRRASSRRSGLVPPMPVPGHPGADHRADPRRRCWPGRCLGARRGVLALLAVPRAWSRSGCRCSRAAAADSAVFVGPSAGLPLQLAGGRLRDRPCSPRCSGAATTSPGRSWPT